MTLAIAWHNESNLNGIRLSAISVRGGHEGTICLYKGHSHVREVKNAFKRRMYEWLAVGFECLMRSDLTTDWCY